MIYAILVLILMCIHGCGDFQECRQSSQCKSSHYCAQGSCVAFPSDETTSSAIATDPDPDLASTTVEYPSVQENDDEELPLPVHPCASARPPAAQDLLINEVYASVGSGLEGDANNDGIRDPYSDEFIELYNASQETLRLDGTSLYVGDHLRWMADEPYCLPPNRGLVVFASGTPNLAADIAVVIAETRLSLANTGGIVRLMRDTEVLDQFPYSDVQGVSWTRQPEATPGGTPTPHAVCGAVFSPGRCCDGSFLEDGCASE